MVLDLSDPVEPVLVGMWNESYAHDVQVVTYTEGPYSARQIAFVSTGGDGLKIVDVTDKAAMQTLSTLVYPNQQYTYQAWLSADRRHLFVNDELDEIRLPEVTLTTTYVVNVEDLENPLAVVEFFGRPQLAPSVQVAQVRTTLLPGLLHLVGRARDQECSHVERHAPILAPPWLVKDGWPW